ncbi:hypothetical protein [Alteromonas sp. ASW11-130]|uniref:hypothetical protein n=1 Tax=Alteromonas sp. ASW11-130 TaxID=3015775 RepID=UPI0022420814|nr:hypothetical protein [Alteromonas sp. ASW11-130]MCW8090565.1 hypothetical protein [Alteromonas sp. ASW11-130]
MASSIRDEIKTIIREIGIDEEQFCLYTALPAQALNDAKHADTKRLKEILLIVNMLEAMSDSRRDAWNWYTKQTIRGGGNITSSQVVIENRESGASAVINYIKSKKLGGFE